MTKITLGASIVLAALGVLQGPRFVCNDETGSEVQRPGYGPLPFTPRAPRRGVTLAEEMQNVRRMQERLGDAIITYEQAYEQATTEIRAEQARTKSASIRAAQDRLVEAIAEAHAVALQRAKGVQHQLVVALANAQDTLHGQNATRLAGEFSERQGELAAITREANDAAGFLNDQTTRLQRSWARPAELKPRRDAVRSCSSGCDDL